MLSRPLSPRTRVSCPPNHLTDIHDKSSRVTIKKKFGATNTVVKGIKVFLGHATMLGCRIDNFFDRFVHRKTSLKHIETKPITRCPPLPKGDVARDTRCNNSNNGRPQCLNILHPAWKLVYVCTCAEG